MGLFGPPDIARLRAKRDVPGLVRALDAYRQQPVRRAEIVVALGEVGDARATQGLVRMLADAQPVEIRVAAARALGKVGDGGAFEALRGLMDSWRQERDQGPGVPGGLQDAATQALGQLGGRTTDAALRERIEQALIRALDGTQHGRMPAATRALAGMRSTAAVGPLVRHLGGLGRTDYLIEALDRIGDPQAIPGLVKVLDAGGPGERRPAAAALERLGWKPGTTEERASYLAARGDWKGCVALGEAAVPALERVLKWADKDDTQGAASALASLGDAGLRVLVAELIREDKNSRSPVAKALAAVGQRALPVLLAQLEAEPAFGRNVTGVLDQIGWQPGADVAGACYWVARDEHGRCLEIGPAGLKALGLAVHDGDQAAFATLEKAGPAGIPGLLAALEGGRCILIPEMLVVEALQKAGYQPGKDEGGARYSVEQEDWERCVQMGSVAVAALIDALHGGSPGKRRGAAGALVRIYQQGGLDEACREMILAQRTDIMGPHTDYTEYADDQECHIHKVDHTDSGGAGVAFPL